jgi:hypothetical protein
MRFAGSYTHIFGILLQRTLTDAGILIERF